jgi:Peptidase C39 family
MNGVLWFQSCRPTLAFLEKAGNHGSTTSLKREHRAASSPNAALSMYAVTSRFLGLILLAASVLKAHEIATSAPADFGANATVWVLSACVEGVLAMWLMTGIWPGPTRWLLIGYFTLLLDVSLFQALGGEPSCGCFGRIAVNPWATFALNSVAIGALLIARPNLLAPNLGSGVRLRAVTFAALVCAWVLTEALVVLHSQPANFDARGELHGDSDVVVLEPQTWVGRRLPLLQYIDRNEQLEHGGWLVLLYHRECSKCRAAVARCVATAYELASQGGGTRVALVEAPPYDGERAPSAPKGALCVRARLTDRKRWRVGGPVFLRMEEGVVQATSKSLEPLLAAGDAADVAPSQTGRHFPDYRRVRRQLFLRHIACGPLALIAILQQLDVPVGPEEMEGLLSEAGSQGIDMLRLKQLAENQGLHALGVAVSTQKLRDLGHHAIAYLEGQGFVAVTGYVPDGLEVVDPLRPGGIIPDDLFARSFGSPGYALLVSREPLLAAHLGLVPAEMQEEQAPGPRLSLSRNILAVGRIHQWQWEAAVTITNDGTQPLELKEVKSCCPDIMTVVVENNSLAPGRATALRAKGKQRVLGAFAYYAEIVTNQERYTTVRVPVRGYLELPVSFEPAAVRIDEVLPNERAVREILLDVSSDVDLNRLVVQTPEKQPLQAKIRPGRDGQPTLAFEWLGAPEPGWHHTKISVKTGTPDALAAELPVAVQVVPDIQIDPPSLLIREKELETAWSRRVTITFRRNLITPRLGIRADATFPERAVVSCAQTGEKTLTVTLSAKLGGNFVADGQRRAELSIEFPDMRKYFIPVYLGDEIPSEKQGNK